MHLQPLMLLVLVLPLLADGALLRGSTKSEVESDETAWRTKGPLEAPLVTSACALSRIRTVLVKVIGQKMSKLRFAPKC